MAVLVLHICELTLLQFVQMLANVYYVWPQYTELICKTTVIG